ISGGLKSTGQKCTATSRVIVQAGIYDEFKEKLIKKVAEITVGNGLENSTWMGPSVSKSQLETVTSYIKKGLDEGATLLTGGNEIKNLNGYFVEPTVFEVEKHDMTITKEEIFGPVLALMRVDSIE